jgi:hypothetical protein
MKHPLSDFASGVEGHEQVEGRVVGTFFRAGLTNELVAGVAHQRQRRLMQQTHRLSPRRLDRQCFAASGRRSGTAFTSAYLLFFLISPTEPFRLDLPPLLSTAPSSPVFFLFAFLGLESAGLGFTGFGSFSIC